MYLPENGEKKTIFSKIKGAENQLYEGDEDLAEAFVFFVTGDLGPGNEIRHQKIDFFYWGAMSIAINLEVPVA